ncbi:hypothetical protein EYF80_033065 [Liparis tanakae]|uniref:Uncharacterized protein n=1 Tax=Liparis tanakae TaxID=230148 RepID=A0A4Z2GU29_9TELE|nr:hypothetical protein EYF80_033065 [Liparis tanakae]
MSFVSCSRHTSPVSPKTDEVVRCVTALVSAAADPVTPRQFTSPAAFSFQSVTVHRLVVSVASSSSSSLSSTRKGNTSTSSDSILRGKDPALSSTECLLAGGGAACGWRGNELPPHKLGLERHQSEMLCRGIVAPDADAAAATRWRSHAVSLPSAVSEAGDATAAEPEKEEEPKRAATFW